MTAAEQRATAPSGAGVAHREETAEEIHGHTVRDPYRWLESDDTPQTRAWLADQRHRFTEEAARWPMRAWLTGELRTILDHETWSLPRHRGGTVFATRRAGDGEHPVLLARDTGGWRVLFDPAAADPSGETTLDGWEPGPDGRLVALQVSSGGTERGELRVVSAATGHPVAAPIPEVRYSDIAWCPPWLAPDAFYYVRRDGGDGRRGVWLHRVGSQHPDTLVHPCGAPRTVPGVRVERWRWLVVSESHGTGHRDDVWIADLAAAPIPEEVRPVAVHTGVAAETELRVGPDGRLYARTTLHAPRRRVCRASPTAPAITNWHEVVAEDPEATLDSFAVTSRAEILVSRTRLGISELTVHARADGRVLRHPPLPGEGMISRVDSVDDADTAAETAEAYIGYADVTTPQTVLAYRGDLPHPTPWNGPAGAARRDTPRRRVLACRSADGTRVWITVLSLRPFDRPRPTILHGYGGFGRPRQFGFSATVLAWLRAGGQYAVAHVRGGGDHGREWHMRGAGRAKRASVADLVSAAEHLVTTGHCEAEQLCLSGGSAGGLLVLAAAVERPEICAAVIASAPLADMVRFERMGLGAMWRREFGSIDDPADLAALLSYSPYHRVRAGRSYPAVLLTGFHGDTRTGAAHPRKMCAALQWASSSGRPVLLRYEYGVGHGPRALTRAVALAADAHAFAAAATGLAAPPAPAASPSPHGERPEPTPPRSGKGGENSGADRGRGRGPR